MNDMAWEDLADEGSSDDRLPLTLGDLRDGEECTITIEEEPEEFESDEYGPGVRVPATFHESDYDHKIDGKAIEEGDEVALITWSSRLVAALVELTETGAFVGETVAIEKSGDGMDTNYTAERVS